MENRFQKISQVGFVVRDLTSLIENMQMLFNMKPRLGMIESDRVLYRGEYTPCKAQIAYFDFANIELEFVMPLIGNSIWQDFLDAGHEGLHHIRFAVDDSNGGIADMEGKGVPVYAQGASIMYPGKTWTYFDTADTLKFIVEMIDTGCPKDAGD